MPRGIPPLTQRLIVAGNTIPVLGEAAVVGNGSELLLLDTLDLQGNCIRRIAPGAFEGLSNLKTLNLSENALGSIASDAFRDLSLLHTLCMNRALHQLPAEQLWTALDPRHLPNLTQIQLVGNQLRNLPEDLPTSPKWEMLDLRDNLLGRVGERTTSWLQQHPSLKVYLSSNPFVCDCQLWPMYLWLKNTSQVGDKKKMTCHCPQPLNGTLLTQLTAEDFKCPEADAASYVFLGIVLALIGATFLMVLYLNRKGIKRWASNFREACRDQMEGYEYRYEHDSEPGVASVSAVV
ncbi:wnt-activated inhibitory factor 2 [Pristis pectinata]|uniref:wnt-activated inhibitory factor 2 n=1 Tax=Pristis pectinata TaxID=685728 RepID=UPI00223D6B3B|nr:wnt-activated inhibitory factor 2 [Pristis pectinata]